MLRKVRDSEHEDILALAAQQGGERLRDEEYARLQTHLERCNSCREIAEEYKLLVDYGRALRTSMPDVPSPDNLWNHEQQKSALLARLHSEEEYPVKENPRFWKSRWPALMQVSAASVLLVIASGYSGYRFGTSKENSRHAAPVKAIVQNYNVPAAADIHQTEAQNALQQASASQEVISRLEVAVESLSMDCAKLAARSEELSTELSKKNENVHSIEMERDDVAGRLNRTEQLLHAAEQDLQKAQEERSRNLLRLATAEFKAQQLSEQLGEKEETIARQQQYLESDRDIRELMGARQLYIADVVDVDHNGQNRKPFGRVFYTKGKSLVFYGFDLDQQPGVRNASVFQVWGHSDGDEHRPVNLGIFYLDNETNHRWVLKADNPELLSQLDAVFVTVEKNRQSKQPTSKPFLYTYLRKGVPNHP